ncbi:hypothetical protein [Streptomyces albofaciens]|uniref:hypothetical protein n=1 Tax=Streptomyces albofaciens TaxID=66866 RepID=UPI000AD8C300|nr:hypothetical protein [Streptomyces albofaciens]
MDQQSPFRCQMGFPSSRHADRPLIFTPRDYAFAPRDFGSSAAYRKVCRVAALTPLPDGYGLLLVVDDTGDKHTLATADVEYVRAIADACPTPEVLAGLTAQREIRYERGLA